MQQHNTENDDSEKFSAESSFSEISNTNSNTYSESTDSEHQRAQKRTVRRREGAIIRLLSTTLSNSCCSDLRQHVAQFYASNICDDDEQRKIKTQVCAKLGFTESGKSKEFAPKDWAVLFKYTLFQMSIDYVSNIVSFCNGKFEAHMPLFVQFGVYMKTQYNIGVGYWFALFMLQNLAAKNLNAFFDMAVEDKKWIKMLHLNTPENAREHSRRCLFDNSEKSCTNMSRCLYKTLCNATFSNDEELVNEWVILLQQFSFGTEKIYYDNGGKQQKILLNNIEQKLLTRIKSASARIQVQDGDAQLSISSHAKSTASVSDFSPSNMFSENKAEKSVDQQPPIPNELRRVTRQLFAAASSQGKQKKEQYKMQFSSNHPNGQTAIVQKFRDAAKLPLYTSDAQLGTQWWLAYLSASPEEMRAHFVRQYAGTSDISVLEQTSEQRVSVYEKIVPRTIDDDVNQISPDQWHDLLKMFDFVDSNKQTFEQLCAADPAGSSQIVDFYEKTMKSVLPERLQTWSGADQIKHYLTVAMASEMMARSDQKAKKQDIRTYWTSRWNYEWDLKPHVADAVDEYVRLHTHIPFATKQFLLCIVQQQA